VAQLSKTFTRLLSDRSPEIQAINKPSKLAIIQFKGSLVHLRVVYWNGPYSFRLKSRHELNHLRRCAWKQQHRPHPPLVL